MNDDAHLPPLEDELAALLRREAAVEAPPAHAMHRVRERLDASIAAGVHLPPSETMPAEPAPEPPDATAPSAGSGSADAPPIASTPIASTTTTAVSAADTTATTAVVSSTAAATFTAKTLLAVAVAAFGLGAGAGVVGVRWADAGTNPAATGATQGVARHIQQGRGADPGGALESSPSSATGSRAQGSASPTMTTGSPERAGEVGTEAAAGAGPGTPPGASPPSGASALATNAANPASGAPTADAGPLASPGRDRDLAGENALVSRAQSALARGRTGEALEALAEHQRRFPGGEFAEEREALTIQALARSGRMDAARARAERFRARYPRSMLRRAVDAVVPPEESP